MSQSQDQSQPLVFTGERLVPGAVDPVLELEHRQRYQWVLQLAQGKRVLDAACGEGYGSDMLAAVASAVVAVDVSQPAVEQAKERYRRPNLSFVASSVTSLPLADQSVDLVVSFETIEHIGQADQRLFLEETRRVLAPGGVLVISTPDRVNYSERRNYHNEYHVHEFSREEFSQFLAEWFTHVRLLGQRTEAAMVLSGEETQSLRPMQAESQPASNSRYLIAICSQESPPRSVGGSICYERDNVFEKQTQRIVELQDEVQRRGAWGLKLSREVAELTTIRQDLDYLKEHPKHMISLGVRGLVRQMLGRLRGLWQ